MFTTNTTKVSDKKGMLTDVCLHHQNKQRKTLQNKQKTHQPRKVVFTQTKQEINKHKQFIN